MSGHTATPVDSTGVWMNAYADAHLQLATFKKAAGKLAAMARTSGGVAGRDDRLCAACDEVERLIVDAKPLPPNSHADLVRALQFYASEWQPNGEGDPETPGLSRSWVEPTDELHNDGGRKARAALATLTARKVG